MTSIMTSHVNITECHLFQHTEPYVNKNTVFGNDRIKNEISLELCSLDT
jgi:hypothetical protein